MKAEELRIGNFVNLYGDECRIQTVGMWVHTDTTVDEAPIESVKPVPLTEEWLTQFGFRKQQNGDYVYERAQYIVYTCRFNSISNRLSSFGILTTDDNGDYNGLVNFTWDIQFVHQLQNLYFALTSEELTLKEKL